MRELAAEVERKAPAEEVVARLEELAAALQRNDQHTLDTLRSLRHDTEVREGGVSASLSEPDNTGKAG